MLLNQWGICAPSFLQMLWLKSLTLKWRTPRASFSLSMWYTLRHASFNRQHGDLLFLLFSLWRKEWHMSGSQAGGLREGVWTQLLAYIKTEFLSSHTWFFSLPSAGNMKAKVACKMHCTLSHFLSARKIKWSKWLHSSSTQTIFKLVPQGIKSCFPYRRRFWNSVFQCVQVTSFSCHHTIYSTTPLKSL